MENIIKIMGEGRKSELLPMKGTDKEGNLYEVDNISLIKNGKRFLPVMGEFHFSRYEPEDWEQELLKMRSGGVDIVATYTFWIHHEEKKGEWDFSGCRNLQGFLEVCKKISMPVWLRIGPWAHGECRNGGFPDWLIQEEFKTRTDDPVYLKFVREFYSKIGQQAKGMMLKDGGPIMGIQLENEYGHCGGPVDRTEGLTHMSTLKKLAQEIGFEVPYYTATGWGGAYVVDTEMLPVLGGYVDAPWAEHVDEMPVNENFIFSSYKQDENIGSDIGKIQEQGLHFDIFLSPYLTAELGGGLQVTSHRRTYPWPEDIEAQSICMLGSGANLIGYYMYHGGINPDGKYTTLQESRNTGYANDLPIKSYDFQTCIRESGEINTSYGKLKKIHLLLSNFGEVLAGADTYFAETQPDSAEDMSTLRVTARVNHQEGVGFLFINNHQRKRRMEAHKNCSVQLDFGDKELVISHITVKSDECAIMPFLIPDTVNNGWEELLPSQTNTSLLCRVGKRMFFHSNLERPVFQWRGVPADAVVLSQEQAERAFQIGDHLYLTEYSDSCLIQQEKKIFLITKAEKEELIVYGERDDLKKIIVQQNVVNVPVHTELVRERKAEDGSVCFLEYQIQIGKVSAEHLHQLYLEVDYLGDRVEVYLNGRMVDDWFTTGEKWHIAMKRFGYPEQLIFRIYPSEKPISNPYGDLVYYDLPVEPGCCLSHVKTLVEYRTEVPE